MTIFETLESNFSCYAVVVANVSVKGETGHHVKDYFIVADHDNKRFLINNGFHWAGIHRIYTRDMTEQDIADFKAISGDFRMVLSNNEGRVYEQRKWSFKDFYHAEKEAAYVG